MNVLLRRNKENIFLFIRVGLEEDSSFRLGVPEMLKKKDKVKVLTQLTYALKSLKEYEEYIKENIKAIKEARI
jgi:hypothetical protein